MPPLARRNLFHDKVRLTVTLTGIVFAVVLIVDERSVYRRLGLSTTDVLAEVLPVVHL